MSKFSKAVSHLRSSSREYSLDVNDARAIPFIGDGLKHVQRVALWEMRNMQNKTKVISLVGALMESGRYVHGDASCGDAISLLAAPYRNNVKLFEGEGQFGSRVAPTEGIGSPRYVYVKRSKAAQAFLYNDIDIVPMEDNYDGSNQQPIHYLPLIPVVLLNGIAGIGVGYSTDILPHRFQDVVDATIAIAKGKSIKALVPFYERYDIKIAPTGLPNQWLLTGKLKIVDTSTIRITELPPELTLEKFRKRLIEMEDAEQIMRFVDRSSDTIVIDVTFKRGTLAGWSEKQAIDFFKLSERTTERIVVRDWNGDRIVQYDDSVSVITGFVKWRLAWYEKRYQKFNDDASYELQYWKLLRELFKAGFTKKLGTFADRAAIETDVKAVATKTKLKVDDLHIDRAVSLPTYRWTKSFEADVGAKIAELEAQIKDYLSILASPEKRRDIYIAELEALKKMKFV